MGNTWITRTIAAAALVVSAGTLAACGHPAPPPGPPGPAQLRSGYEISRGASLGRDDTLFSDDAIGLIHEASRGLPRVINNLAVSSLIATFAQKKAVVDASAVRVAVAEAANE